MTPKDPPAVIPVTGRGIFRAIVVARTLVLVLSPMSDDPTTDAYPTCPRCPGQPLTEPAGPLTPRVFLICPRCGMQWTPEQLAGR